MAGLHALRTENSQTDLLDVVHRKYSRRHCGRTDLRESEDELVKMNDIPATTKLEWALQMAESMALLHNHPRGVIVHDDVQPFQWLIAEDGHIKMNDFNRAEVSTAILLELYHDLLYSMLCLQFMLYDEEHGEYCKYKNGVGPGDVSIIASISTISEFIQLTIYSPFIVVSRP